MSSDYRQTMGNGEHITGNKSEDEQRTASPSALLTPSSVHIADKKSPLKIPQGVIVRTPSGKDCQGRKTPPRFFAITNERLQNMHSTANSESIGPTHFKFHDSNQSVGAVKECVCKHFPRKTEVNSLESPKAFSGLPRQIGGTITLRSLLEAEIRKSNVSQTPKTTKAGPHKPGGRTKDIILSPSRSATNECSSRNDQWMLNHKEAVSPNSLPLSTEEKEPTFVIQEKARKTVTNPSKPTNQACTESKNDVAVLDPSSKSEGCPGTSNDNILKGSLLDMLLSSNELLCNYRTRRHSQEQEILDNIVKSTISSSESCDQKTVLERTKTKLPNTPPPKDLYTSNCTIDGSLERKYSSKIEVTCKRSGYTLGTSACTETQISKGNRISNSSPKVCTEYSPTLASREREVPPSAFGKDVTAHTSQEPSINNSAGDPSLATVKTEVQDVSYVPNSMDASSLTQSNKADEIPGVSGSSGKAFGNSTEVLKVPCKNHEEKSGLGDLSREVKRGNGNVIASDNAEITASALMVMNDGTPEREQMSTCPSKTMLIINPVKTTSASKGQLYGLVRSSSNAPGTMMLVALGNHRQSTALSSSRNDAEAVKCQSTVPQKISNITSTDKSFVHRALTRLNPPVAKQKSSSNPKKTRKDVVSKAPKSKNCKADIQRQINVIPQLQTTGSDQSVTEKPVPESEQDVLMELYKSTNMDAISPDFPVASNNSTFRKVMKSSSDFLNDQESSFDPMFAHCLLSGRPHDIDNWMAMKTNWRVTPEWIVDFIADSDRRKRARRAAIDAGVMRRVANAQRMVGMKEEDDDAGSSTSKVHPPRKHSGKKCQQFGDSRENTPVCQEKVCSNILARGSSPKLDVSRDKKGNRCLTPDKVQNETRTMTNTNGVVNPIPQYQANPQCGKLAPYNDCMSSSCEFMVKSESPVIVGIKPEQSHQTVCPDTTLPNSMPRKDECLMNTLPIQNTEITLNQVEYCTSQGQNLIGDLDRIDDEQLWNLLCNLFPPWQRVSSFIGADTADDFFRDLDRDSHDEPVAPPPPITHTGQMAISEVDRASNILSDNLDADFDSLGHMKETGQNKDCLEVRPIAQVELDSSIMSPATPDITHELRRAPDLPHAKRRLFCDAQIKKGIQSEEYESKDSRSPLRGQRSEDNSSNIKAFDIHENLDNCLESTMGIESSKRSQTHPLSREEEENAAICKLLEILHETQQPPSETFETKDEITYRDKASESCWTAEKNVLMQGDENNAKSGMSGEDEQAEIPSGCLQSVNRHMLADVFSQDHNVIQMTTSKSEKGDTHSSGEINRWQEEIKPIIALAINSSSSSSSVENEIRQIQSKDDQRTTPTVELHAKCDEPVEDQKDGDSADTQEQSTAIPTTSSSSGEYLTADETDQHSRGLENRQTPDICPMLKPEECGETPQCIMTHSVGSAEISTDDPAIGLLGSCAEDSVSDISDEVLDKDVSTIHIMTHNVGSAEISTDVPAIDLLGNCAEGGVSDISDGVLGKNISTVEKKTRDPVKWPLGKSRKKRKQDISKDHNKITSDSSPDVTPSSSDTSLTSVSTSSTSSLCIARNRKGRGRKRRRKAQRHRKKSDRNIPRNCYSPQSIKSEKMKETSSLTEEIGKNNSRGNASSNSTESMERKEPRERQKTDITKLEEQEDGSSTSQDARRYGHEDEDDSDNDSQGDFIVADQSPTSLKIVKRRSSRLKIRRVSSLPRLRIKRNAPGKWKKSASRSKLHVKVKSVERKNKK